MFFQVIVGAAVLSTAIIGITSGVPMGSSHNLSPRYALGAWPGKNLSQDVSLVLNIVQGLFRGFLYKVLPPAVPSNACTPIPLNECCPSGWTQIGSSCYTVLPPQTLAAARDACRVLGRGHLLDINSYDENSAILPWMKNETCDGKGCLVGYADQYKMPEKWDGNSVYVEYQTPCAGAGLIQVEAAENLEMPCNIVYAGSDDISKYVLDQIKCTGPDTSAMIAVCELELNGDPSKFVANYPMCMSSSSGSGGSD